MPALALSFAFFLFATLLGRAALALCRWRAGVLRAWLLSPATGLAVIVLAVMVLNQAGLPVSRFAWPLAIALAAATAVILFWRRPIVPTRQLLPFITIAVFSLFWTGWPMLRFGFAWLSYVNDDFVNYCFAAERFKDFSFWRVPTMEELAGKDVSQYYWFMHVPGLMRFGSEIVLAWVSALTGVKALGIFMPVIVALGLIQIFSAAGLVLHRGRWRRRALIASLLLAASPLFMLGTLYQLIAQVGGLALMLAATAFLTARLPSHRRRLVPHVVALSLVGAAVAVFYPEVTAFAVLTTVLVSAIDWFRAARRQRSITPAAAGRGAWQPWIATFPVMRTVLILYGVVGVLLLLRYNVLSYVFTIMLQMGSGFRSVDLSLSLFPYFMIPTGLANLFGLMPLAVNYAEPITSLSIVAGLLALATALGFALRESFRPAPIAILLLVQFVLAIRLMTSGNDFGLYKIAMFMQPALAAALACALLKLPWSRFTAPVGVVAALALCAPTALYYTRVSQGEKAGGITEAKLASILGTTPPAIPPDTRVLADINNLVAAKIAACELRGTDLRFLSRDFYQQIAPIEYERLGDTLVALHPHFEDLLRTRAMLEDRDRKTIRTHTVFENTRAQTSFRAPALGFGDEESSDTYLMLDEALGLFNKLRTPPAAQAAAFFKSIPAASTRNHLVFVHSGRGNHYYLGDRQRISLYQPEADPYTDRQDITGLGRFLLLRVERPDDEFYLRIAASKTFMRGGHTAWSPGSQILGASPVPLPFLGNGAVNRVVGPLRPIFRDGVAYVAIDLNETPVQFPYHRGPLEALYNTEVPLDSRKLVAYGRDISALAATEVAALPRPSRLTRFPDDLLFARGLEFSGIYEDGWLSPKSEFILGGGGPAAWIRVRGFVPSNMPGSPIGTGMLKASLPGGDVELPAPIGSFDWLLPVGSGDNLARLGLAFTATSILPNGDDRPVGGKLEWLEVFPSLPTYTFEFGKPTSARLASTGIDQDGWFARQATIQLPPFETAHDILLTFEYPGWSDKSATVVSARWPGVREPVTITLTPRRAGDHARAPPGITPAPHPAARHRRRFPPRGARHPPPCRPAHPDGVATCRPLVTPDPHAPASAIARPRSAVVLKIDTLGDLVVFAPVLQCLRSAWPETRLVALIRRAYLDLAPLLVPGVEWLATTLDPFAQGPGDDPAEVARLREAIAALQPEVVAAATSRRNWLEVAVAAAAPDARRIALGASADDEFFATRLRVELGLNAAQVFAEQIPVPSGEPDWRGNYHLADALLGRAVERIAPSIARDRTTHRPAADFLAAHGLRAGRFAVCAAAGFANVQIKTWPADRFAAALRLLQDKHGLPVVLVGHESERAHLDSIATQVAPRPELERGGMPPPAVDWRRPILWLGRDGSLPELAALLAQSALYFGNDTGAMHLAAALDVPVVAIFGGGTWPRFVPAARRGAAVVHPLPCFGCGWDCAFGDAPCLGEITVADAVAGIEHALGRDPAFRIQPVEHLSSETRVLMGKAAARYRETRDGHLARQHKLEDLTALSREKDGEIASLKAVCDEREKTIFILDGHVRNLQAENAALKADRAVMEKTLASLPADAARAAQTIADQVVHIRNIEALLRQRENEIVEARTSAGHRVAGLHDLEQAKHYGRLLAEKETAIQSLRAALASREKVIRQLSAGTTGVTAALHKLWIATGDHVREKWWRPFDAWLFKRVVEDYWMQIGILRHYSPRPLKWDERIPGARLADAAVPQVAIVTPSYAQEKFIERTLRSVLDQRYPRLVYVVQDGGSPDRSAEIIAGYAPQLHHWESIQDRGQADAIHRGFAQVTHLLGPDDIMAWLNSDDLLAPGSLRFVAEYFATHPEIDVLYGHRIIVDDDDREVGRWIMPRHNPATLEWIDYVPQETLFWRKRAWDIAGGIDPSYQFALDWDLLARFQQAGCRMVRVPYFLGAFRVHAGQKTSQAIHTTGADEMRRIRMRFHGERQDDFETINRHARQTRFRGALTARLHEVGIRR